MSHGLYMSMSIVHIAETCAVIQITTFSRNTPMMGTNYKGGQEAQPRVESGEIIDVKTNGYWL